MSSPRSKRSLILAWAMSRATMIVPLRLKRVLTGNRVSWAKTSFIGRLRSTFTPPPSPASRKDSGIKRAGLSSRRSIQRPSLLILHLIFLSAEQLTPIPIGQLAPWRGRRTTRISWAKYLPPNCAPKPMLCASRSSSFSNSTSRKARPVSSPVVGSPS